MSIDWFTFTAQIVNFLVLVALLRWVLYDRVVDAMNEREEKIASRLEEAGQKESEAEAEAERYRQQRKELESQQDELLAEARDEAEEEKERLMKQAREEIEQKREEWQSAYQQQRDDFLDDLRRQAGHAGLEAARHALKELANADLEAQMYESFKRQLEQLDRDQRQQVRQHLGNSHSKLQIQSAFDIPQDQQDALRDAVRDAFETEADIKFDHEANLICGLELNVGGYNLGWNTREFLSDLELEFDQRLKATE